MNTCSKLLTIYTEDDGSSSVYCSDWDGHKAIAGLQPWFRRVDDSVAAAQAQRDHDQGLPA